MGAAIDTGGDKKSVNVHLNIVPFIDLMSCLTAFLLVTAVWSNLAQISIKPKGVARQAEEPLEENEQVRASILIQENLIWVGLSRINDFSQIAKKGETYDWEELRRVLEEHKKTSYFADRQDIEVAAEDKISYQSIISTMDVAVAAGFIDVGLADPNSLSARPTL
ncbi:MAG: biopolymer transporter ExbD [Proteobacteria bacterium]|nr:biopolymer transporter ExbD [Pseudomonadota bacterium]